VLAVMAVSVVVAVWVLQFEVEAVVEAGLVQRVGLRLLHHQLLLHPVHLVPIAGETTAES